jgi:alpha-beta hydrolase superfamily lysophospholipase
MRANKPLKDLAWGLGSLEIATLRYDKVTYAHAAKLVGNTEFTMVDEYVDHAVAAIELLQDDPSIDPAHIYLLGHSQGGTILPRIASGVASVAGMIILAGGAQPLHRSMVRQVRYLAGLQPGADVENDPAVQAITGQADLIDSPAFSASTPTYELPFDVPAPYWLDAGDYAPVAAAAGLDVPMLILQGGRDYQVTVADIPCRQSPFLLRCRSLVARRICTSPTRRPPRHNQRKYMDQVTVKARGSIANDWCYESAFRAPILEAVSRDRCNTRRIAAGQPLRSYTL